MFILILFIIILLSLGFALISLRNELKKMHEKKALEVTKELDKGRVIFYSPSSSVSESKE